MDWKTFNIDTIKTPSEIIDTEIEGFSQATKNLLMLSLIPKGEIERIRKKYNSNFQYDLVLHSQKMSRFRFDVFELLFDANLFPCYIIIERGLQEEFNFQSNFVNIEDEVDLIKFLEKIFNSVRFEEIVSGLMRISTTAKVEEDEDFPF